MAVSDWTLFAALFCLAVLHLPRGTWCSDLDGWGTLGELATSDCSVHFYDEQKLDHFNPDDTRVFSQRFTVCQNYTTSENSPLLVYIGGESPEGSDSQYTGTTYSRFIQAVGGVFIDLEHRYYGLSYPHFMKDGATTENLKYLGSEQALADLRQFILWMKGLTPNQPDGASTPSVTVRYGMRDSTVTVVGGSYPGALAAWAKLKHGDVIDGAISSSAPVLAQVDFSSIYDTEELLLKMEAIGGSQECFEFWDDAFDLMTSRFIDLVERGRRIPERLMPCDGMGALDLDTASAIIDGLFGVGSAAWGSGWFQYYLDIISPISGLNGARKWCPVAKKYSKQKGGTWKALEKFVHASLPGNATTATCTDYSSLIPGPASEPVTKWPATLEEQQKMAGRLWMWQICTEFGWIQAVIGYGGPEKIAMKFLRTLCEADPLNCPTLEDKIENCAESFGTPDRSFTLDTVQEAVEATNSMYGGRNLNVENVTFINGGLDHWRRFSILPEDQDLFDFCPDAGHTGNSSFCVQNRALDQDALFMATGSHCAWMIDYAKYFANMSSITRQGFVSMNAQSFEALRKYHRISNSRMASLDWDYIFNGRP